MPEQYSEEDPTQVYKRERERGNDIVMMRIIMAIIIDNHIEIKNKTRTRARRMTKHSRLPCTSISSTHSI
jgi:hypothetical protein